MIGKRTLWAMAAGSDLAVANLYYAQPLLAELGRHFEVSERRMGLVATLGPVVDNAPHARMADLLRRYDVNDYAASLKVFAVKPG